MSGSLLSDEDNNFPTAPEKRWEALMRGQVINATTRKFFSYISLVDQKAQGLVFLNSILIPVALTWIDKADFHTPALLCIVTSIISILFSIICIYPKRRNGRKPDGSINILHFSDISMLKEDEFLEEFRPIYNSPALLSEAAAKDLHDVARRIIRPKFFWLKAAYITFFIGNIVAIVFAVIALV